MALAIAGCGPTKDGVAVAPLRPGPALVRYEQARPFGSSRLKIVVLAPESKELKVNGALDSAFGAASTGTSEGAAVDLAVSDLRRAGFDDFQVSTGRVDDGGGGTGYFAGDAGGKAWRITLGFVDGEEIATLALRDEAVHTDVDGHASIVTVLGGDATSAERDAAAIAALPQPARVAELEARKVQGVLLIVSGTDVQGTFTRGLKARIKLAQDENTVRWAEAR